MEHNHSNHNDQHGHSHHSGHANHSDHSGHEGHSIEQFRRRFWVSLVFSLSVLVFSPLIQDFFGYQLSFPGVKWVLFALATFVFFYGGKPFWLGGYQELRQKNPGMMTLIALAIAVAYFYSGAVVLGLSGKLFFWELVTLIDIMLLGHWIEMKSVMGASMALEKLSELIPDQAHRKSGDDFEDVSTSELENGDVILIKPGEKIPTDGIVISGKSGVNESMISGESEPVTKQEGDQVVGGSINEDGSIQVRVEIDQDGSYLSKVMKLVKEAQADKSKTQNLADRAAFWLTIVAISVGLVTFVSWWALTGELALAIERMATVLVITCPHALGLAIPLVVSISTSISARNGLIIRNRTAFENARKISTVIFDKTGTLTEGSFQVKKVLALEKKYDEVKIVKLMASLEQESEHSIAKAILAYAKKKKIELAKVSDFQAIKGRGIEGKISGKALKVVSPGYLNQLGLNLPESAQKLTGTVVFLVEKRQKDYRLLGALNLEDGLRVNSKRAVEQLKKRGIKVWMLTGDNRQVAERVSNELGLEGFFAEVLPDEKQEKVKELQVKGEFVAMVGDGVNDAPALATADIGVAIGSGTDVAAQTADIILASSNPLDIVSLISFGRATYYKMIQNLIWATGYNVIAIPLAAGVLAGVGFVLSPAVGAVLMSLSTVVVAINAKLLKMKE